ncbi:MAG: hypothetical protein M0T74_03790 [Desulfitobacterium hafniense]|nr:hypothetical protein [Desulfitobacterium hafniense]
MKVEIKLNSVIEQKERELHEKFPLTKISEDIQLPIETLELMTNSHFMDVSELKIGEIIKVCDYLGVNFHDFVVVEGSSPDDENSDNSPYSASRCYSGADFKNALSKSKNYEIYDSIPSLINEIANLIDSNPNVIAGCVSNFNLKLRDENILTRFFVKKNKVYIKNVLFGGSINADKRAIYKDIYANFKEIKGKDTIDNETDVTTLISIIKNYI